MPRQQKPHDGATPQKQDTPSTPSAPASLPYPSFDDALIAGDQATAAFYFGHENRTAEWLRSMIAGRKQTAANFDPSKEANAFSNNAETAARAAKLVPLYEAFLLTL